MDNNELRRAIAERLGYRLEKKEKDGKITLTILSPSNAIIRQGTTEQDDLRAEMLMWFNIPHWHIPDWTNDLGAAYKLVTENLQGAYFYLMSDGENSVARIVDPESETVLVKLAGTNPAALICEAWLSFSELLPCTHCDGTGEMEDFDFGQDPGEEETTMVCPHCDGTGKEVERA